MDLTQIQWEAVDAAHAERQVEADAMARRLLLDASQVVAALDDLVGLRLMEQGDGDTFVLTEAGVAIHRDREAQFSNAIKRRATWQR